MKILVTGAAGFIGSHVSEKLLSQGHEVTGIDNLDPFYPSQIKLSNLEKSRSSKKFTFYEGDICDVGKIIGDKEKFDVVIHLAAKAGVRPSIENPSAYIQANIIGTFHLLEWMKKNVCRKFIFGSSSSVYGNNSKTPFSESDQVAAPISPYAFTKRSCELMNFNYHHLHDFSIINLRFFTVYGPRQRPDLAIHKFFKQIYSNEPIQIYGNGNTGRDYTYIDDIVAGITGALERINQHQKLFEIINLGNSNPVLLKDLIQIIEEVSGKKANRNHLPAQEGDVDFTFADISQAKEKLNFSPAVSMKEGINFFKIWYENR